MQLHRLAPGRTALVGAITLLLALAPLHSSAETRIHDEFDRLEWGHWCPCRVDAAALDFRREADGTRFARITVHPGDVGGNKCTGPEREICRKERERNRSVIQMAPQASLLEQRDNLGTGLLDLDNLDLRRFDVDRATSLFGITPPDLAPPGGHYCDNEVRKSGEAKGEEVEEPCNQRQELELQDSLRHPLDAPYDYAFRFRLPKTIEDETHSVRWVIAQWKQDSYHESYTKEDPKFGPSPFLALRFDDGQLRVTVQDEHCRCVVAGTRLSEFPVSKQGSPQECHSTKAGPEDGKECRSGLRAEYGAQPVLSSPRGEWLELAFLIKGGRSAGFVQISERGQMKVRVTGPIGYEADPQARDELGRRRPPHVYFKVGHYRDYQPYIHSMDVDRVAIAPATAP